MKASMISISNISICHRGGFRISSRGWQSNPKGVAKISQGVAKKLRATPLPLGVFCWPTHNITNLRPLFYILDTWYKEVNKIYFFLLFLLNFLSFIRKFDSPQRPRFMRVRERRGGPRHPLKSPLICQHKLSIKMSVSAFLKHFKVLYLPTNAIMLIYQNYNCHCINVFIKY